MTSDSGGSPRHPETRASELTEELKAEILRGEHPAGARLGQNQLAERFHVSRTPVREALHRLVAVGLATFEPNAGFRVRNLSRDEYLDAMLIRSRLEGLAAERAIARITCEQLETLAETAEELEEIGKRIAAHSSPHAPLDDQHRWSQKNLEFHNILLEAADCGPLEVALATTLQSYPREVTWLAAERHSGLMADYAKDHYGICEAVQAGDAKQARDRSRQNVERAIGHLKVIFAEEDDR